jgi:hypothetical protein
MKKIKIVVFTIIIALGVKCKNINSGKKKNLDGTIENKIVDNKGNEILTQDTVDCSIKVKYKGEA